MPSEGMSLIPNAITLELVSRLIIFIDSLKPTGFLARFNTMGFPMSNLSILPIWGLYFSRPFNTVSELFPNKAAQDTAASVLYRLYVSVI